MEVGARMDSQNWLGVLYENFQLGKDCFVGNLW